MKEQKFPPGWDEQRVKELIAHYETQTEDEEFADIEAAARPRTSRSWPSRPNWFRRFGAACPQAKCMIDTLPCSDCTKGHVHFGGWRLVRHRWSEFQERMALFSGCVCF